MGEAPADVYQSTVCSILDKLIGKLEAFAADPFAYQGATHCLSEYMSTLNHHVSLYVSPLTCMLSKIDESFEECTSDFSDTLSINSDVASAASTSLPASASENEVEMKRKERRRETNRK